MVKAKKSSFWFFLPILLLFILTILFCIQSFKFFNTSSVLAETQEALQFCRLEVYSQNRAIENIMQKQWALEGLKINRNIKLQSIDNNEILLDSILYKKKQLWILKFVSSSCEDCQLQEIRFLQKYSQRDNIILIATFNSFREFKLFMKTHNVKLESYYMADKYSFFESEPKDLIHSVTFFKTDTSYIINKVHVGNASFPDISEAYYKMMYHEK